jgi:RNA polymerase sigma-70 factor (ECF subfamily)
MFDSLAERTLTDAAVAGDSAAVEQLLFAHFSALERHIAPRIPAGARREVGVEDVLQDTFAQAFRDIRTFDTHSAGSFLAWLTGIAEHRLSDALKRIRRKKRGGDMNRITPNVAARTSDFGTLIDLVYQESCFPSRIAANEEAVRAVQVAVALLEDDQRDVIRARYLEGLSVKEIAAKAGRTQGAVRGLIHRAKENLRAALGRSSRWLSSR